MEPNSQQENNFHYEESMSRTNNKTASEQGLDKLEVVLLAMFPIQERA